ncbi:MarR family winged helix-turn-helix transcriptional regulator [Pseudotabrizicola alkalilacus]|uniref:MarR family transcriptional regulator n=1 Tax=Pseudotabrizicola alkalilacus TaxID=2305252 RepID=A0A411Z2Q8_9RHOB|nr:MarR family transcriptional regulator [Pseudotabrizicola alkalilacus]RGP37335.1 MarR family transcriptional regulator [Pseudotabrizicola alkalilacus]
MTLALPDMICFALYSATHAMQHVYKPLLDDLGLTYPQYLVLTALWTQDGQTVGALGRQVQLESNTLTPLLKRLEERGLITRTRSETDERQVNITLTDPGRTLKARAAHIPACVLEKSGLSLDDLTRLRDQITTLRDHLRAG